MSTDTRVKTGLQQSLGRIEPGIDQVERSLRLVLKWASICGLIGIAVAINLNVVARYAFGFSFGWANPLSVILDIYVTYVGGAVAYYAGDHVSVSYLYRKFSGRVRRSLTMINNGLILVLGIAMLWFGSQLALNQSSSQHALLGVSLFWTHVPLAVGGLYVSVESIRRIVEAAGTDLEANSVGAIGTFLTFSAVVLALYTVGLPLPQNAILEVGLVFVALIAMILLNVPVAFGMALSTLLFLLVFPNSLDILQPLLVVQQMGQAIGGFSILAIPMFIYAGRLMTATGITRRIIDFANLLVGRLRAGLSHVNVVTSMLFAGISGSAVADTAAVGSVLIPAMKEEGYDSGYASAITCSSSIIGPIIPPSIIMIVFAITIPEVGVSALFIAGVVPGILFGLGLMVATYAIGWRTDWERVPEVDTADRPSAGEALSITRDALLALVMPVIIVGGILSGVFTPTEAGAVAVGYTLLVGVFVYDEMDLESFVEASYSTVTMAGVTLFIIGAARPITYLMAIKSVPEAVGSALFALTQHPTALILLIVGLLAVLAMFIESIANILLWAPVFTPLVVQVGGDPLHFAVVMIMTLAMGMITPPLGVTLFVAAPIADTDIETITKNLVWFFVVEAIVLLSVILFPEIALWLPRTLGYA